MKLTITDAAKEKIQNKVQGNAKFFLSLDDGVGNFSDAGSCAIDTSFDLIAVDPDLEDKDFNASMDSDLGKVYYKDYSESYLDQNLKLDVKYNSLILSGDSGMIDGNVPVVDKRK
ncbi:iron-sulfur cluster biosynthesis family protein [Apilactobacillus bombintestini]|uniref:Iron-sulfur cluster biosynthesis family protein n=1 Tax=Apilactobacillus bombintestini TaxID=2419772 RepID=A0A387AYR6_9LACO|nr:iron-sulfur cluster biosynthesis family protein [Apilactobacillus bombintestini]AYF92200.1 iron-sulfur cluster biosynthesis family protein [Apilactobacillus bombintestini]